MISKKERNRLLKLRKFIIEECYKGTLEFDPHDLCGGCATLGFLSYLYLKNKYPIYFCTNEEHAFCMIGDNIVDLTATQFDFEDSVKSIYFPSLFICDYYDFPDRYKDREEVWCYKFKEKNLTKIKKHLKEWESDQNPLSNLKNLNINSLKHLESLIEMDIYKHLL